jgi:hypothetical protein
VVAGLFLAFDIYFRGPLQHALMNVEGIVALSLVALTLVRSGTSQPIRDHRSFDLLALAAILGLVALAFAPIVHTPFLYDDYTHIADASRSSWNSVGVQFGRLPVPGLFFRPVGFLFYWLNYLAVGANATLWHAGNIALHAACSCLVYALCRQLGLSSRSGLAAALLFGLCGISAESVAWVDAGFVILTTALILLSLIAVCGYAATGRVLWLIAALIFGACAMLSKETAFCLPFLIASLALFLNRKQWRRIGIATTFSGLLTFLLFLYRWWAIRGIGGYAGTFGNVSILHFNLVRTLDALFLRQWAVLFFPMNWSVSAGPILRLALAASPFILGACLWMSKPSRRAILGCIAFIVAAALPVEHLLLISPDLGGSRTLYLGSVGWALLVALILEGIGATPRLVAACVLLALQAAILEHNLAIWRDTAALARSICVDFGRKIAGSSGPVTVSGLPAIRNGAVFMHNGFPQCVGMNTGVPASRIQTEPRNDASKFVWDSANSRIEEAEKP